LDLAAVLRERRTQDFMILVAAAVVILAGATLIGGVTVVTAALSSLGIAAFAGAYYLGTVDLATSAVVAQREAVTRLGLGFVEGEGSPEAFYARLGFVRSGRVFDDEPEMILLL